MSKTHCGCSKSKSSKGTSAQALRNTSAAQTAGRDNATGRPQNAATNVPSGNVPADIEANFMASLIDFMQHTYIMIEHCRTGQNFSMSEEERKEKITKIMQLIGQKEQELSVLKTEMDSLGANSTSIGPRSVGAGTPPRQAMPAYPMGGMPQGQQGFPQQAYAPQQAYPPEAFPQGYPQAGPSHQPSFEAYGSCMEGCYAECSSAGEMNMGFYEPNNSMHTPPQRGMAPAARGLNKRLPYDFNDDACDPNCTPANAYY